MYAELRCKTYYSFLEGASSPKELLDKAISLGLRALAITDRNGVYGIPKAYLAAKGQPTSHCKLISGAELVLDEKEALPSLTLLSIHRKGYGLLCRALTQSHVDQPKGEARILFSEFMKLIEKYPEGAQGLIVLPRFYEDFGKIGGHRRQAQDHKEISILRDVFKDRLYLPVSRFKDEKDRFRLNQVLELSKRFQLKIVATNDVHTHVPDRQKLQDVLTSIRVLKPLQSTGFKHFSNHERYLKSPLQMKRLFSDLPEAIAHTCEIADRCEFSPSELRYRYPSEWIPVGKTAQSYLADVVHSGSFKRYPNGVPSDVKEQLFHELTLIESLNFADYFLTIWEIVEFARQKQILCQGRGSAANSIVCYCLGITAVDPVKMKLLFERFISAERGEPPDIDVDFEHERREEVIQHIYEKYGRDRAAMVSAVITYRARSAIRQVTKAFGREIDKRAFQKLETNLANKGNLEKSQFKKIKERVEEILDFPRHLSIHSGGFTLSADPIIETVPVEPATMEGRTIVQWDKYDLDILGLLKVDVLALGMLSALKKTLNLIGYRDLSEIPPDDRKTYEMIQRADTIGTFQIESRAQMSMLPRLLPKNFYDLVIEVALVRPGPIVGKMVHPYLKRRRGQEPVVFPDPRLKSILGRTLGVPLFQEQVMKIAIVLADFTPGEADELRRAIGAWRSSGSIDKIGRRLMSALLKNGIPQDYADLIFTQIQGFAEYGFPESHAASFALLAYASSYLKCHYPGEFTCALLNSQPMGFYAPHTLVDDAKRHGVLVLPIHLNQSKWDCEMEWIESKNAASGKSVKVRAIRLGWRYVHGLSKREGEAIVQARTEKPFQNLGDFLSRIKLRRNLCFRFALGDVFSCFGYERRQALWELLKWEPLTRWMNPVGMNNRVLKAKTKEASVSPHIQLNLFKTSDLSTVAAPFERASEYQAITLDYDVFGLSTQGHPMSVVRKQLSAFLSRATAQSAKLAKHGHVVEIAGISIVMQRPPTAGGVVFATLEDETGFLDLILHKPVFEKFKETILDHSFLKVKGRIQRDGQSISMIVLHLLPLFSDIEVQSILSEGVRG